VQVHQALVVQQVPELVQQGLALALEQVVVEQALVRVLEQALALELVVPEPALEQVPDQAQTGNHPEIRNT